jgi:hypothetical protein
LPLSFLHLLTISRNSTHPQEYLSASRSPFDHKMTTAAACDMQHAKRP